jgi:hypothetical protein
MRGAVGDFGRSSVPSSSLPTFSVSMVNAAFGPGATIVAPCDASVATKSDAIWPPPDPASAEPQFGNYKRTRRIVRPHPGFTKPVDLVVFCGLLFTGCCAGRRLRLGGKRRLLLALTEQ